MENTLLHNLKQITLEEKEILNGSSDVKTDLYTQSDEFNNFTIDSKKLLKKGDLIQIRPHTRFIHFPKHKHNYVEVVYMYSGSTTHIINDSERIVLQAGDVLFLNQNVTQEVLPAKEDDIAVNFIILPEFFYKSLSMLEQENILRDFLISTLSNDSSFYLHFSAKNILPVKNLFENMIWTIFKDTYGTNIINQTTMGLVFMNLSVFADSINKNQSDEYEQNLIFNVLKYIESNYKNGTLSEISEKLKKPAYYVSKLLKKYTGKNFKELLQERKLQHAAYLLSQTTLTIENIMNTVGYDNSSYFYRKFKDKYGLSPKKYRDSLL